MTLVESRHPRHQALSTQLLDAIMPYCGNALRLALPAHPAREKYLLEAFGMLLIREGLKVAVIAVDPSSPVTGGSILGDKTRMNDWRVPKRRLFARYHPPVIWRCQSASAGINAVMRSGGL